MSEIAGGDTCAGQAEGQAGAVKLAACANTLFRSPQEMASHRSRGDVRGTCDNENEAEQMSGERDTGRPLSAAGVRSKALAGTPVHGGDTRPSSSYLYLLFSVDYPVPLDK